MNEYDYLVDKLVPLIFDRLMAASTAAGEIEPVTSLDNIKALAAYRRIGGTEKTVEVPLSILTRPIDDIVELCKEAADSVVDAIARTDAATANAVTATGAANIAAKAANDAAAMILTLKEDTLAAAQEARSGAKEARDETAASRVATAETITATGKATEATSKADAAEAKRATAETGRVNAEKARAVEEDKRVTAETGRIDVEKTRVTAETERINVEKIRVTAESKRVTAETARVNAENKRATDTATRLADADAAIERMTELSDHPTYIGEDYYVYRWNEATKSYQKTDIYTKGEGLDYTTMTDEEKEGIKGMSAYELAVAGGFVGTVAQWLVSIEGKTGAAGRDFEVPTLNVFPGEGTLGYPSGGSLVLFKIGQLARVWDPEKGDAGGYVFWQLFDIKDNKAVWQLYGNKGSAYVSNLGHDWKVTIDNSTGKVEVQYLNANDIPEDKRSRYAIIPRILQKDGRGRGDGRFRRVKKDWHTCAASMTNEGVPIPGILGKVVFLDLSDRNGISESDMLGRQANQSDCKIHTIGAGSDTSDTGVSGVWVGCNRQWFTPPGLSRCFHSAERSFGITNVRRLSNLKEKISYAVSGVLFPFKPVLQIMFVLAEYKGKSDTPTEPQIGSAFRTISEGPKIGCECTLVPTGRRLKMSGINSILFFNAK
ncbi:MAG: hypothetical protein LBV18_04080 [Alistipes sp.]|jgi:hypothetical protein|nr:hypothetical protein [Alistipes sp.]